MTDMLAVFIHPVELARWQQMLMMLPLCLSIAVVYKTTKCETVRRIPMAALVSFVTIVLGMYAVGMGLILLYHFAA